MDDRLKKALDFANYRLTLQTQRKNIDARVESMLLLNYNNYVFKVTQDLIGYVSAQVSLNPKKVLYIADSIGNTSSIDKSKEFLKKLLETYDKAMQLKWDEQQKLKKARATKTVVGAK
jgi:hypothetical protein